MPDKTAHTTYIVAGASSTQLSMAREASAVLRGITASPSQLSSRDGLMRLVDSPVLTLTCAPS